MNIQRKNSAHHFLMQNEREQTLARFFLQRIMVIKCISALLERLKKYET